MKLTKDEKETIINFTEAEEAASIYTHKSMMKRKLFELAEQRPDKCFCAPGKNYDGVTYSFTKGWISNPSRELSEDQKERPIESLFTGGYKRLVEGRVYKLGKICNHKISLCIGQYTAQNKHMGVCIYML